MANDPKYGVFLDNGNLKDEPLMRCQSKEQAESAAKDKNKRVTEMGLSAPCTYVVRSL